MNASLNPTATEAPTGHPPDDLESLRKALSEAQLFRGVGIEAIEYLLPECRIVKLAPNATLLHRNSASASANDNIYVVLDGALKVFLVNTGEDAVAAIGSGDCTGELSVIDGGTVSADVVAVRAR